MTLQLPHNPRHVSDLLPAYLNGTLDQQQHELVREHLVHCQACRLALADWEEMQQAAHSVTQAQPSPSLTALEGIWDRIDVWEARRSQRGKVGQVLLHCWLVCQRQVSLLPKSIWIASFLLISLACALAAFFPGTFPERTYQARLLLALFTAATTAIGSAFIYRADRGNGMEVTLSTPTSLRLVLLCRILLLIGYNVMLSTLASLVLARVQGIGLWEIIQFWLGPTLLLASLSIILSSLLSSGLALAVSLIIEATQALPIYLSGNNFIVQLAQSGFWHTNVPIILLALFLIAFAIYYTSWRWHHRQ